MRVLGKIQIVTFVFSLLDWNQLENFQGGLKFESRFIVRLRALAKMITILINNELVVHIEYIVKNIKYEYIDQQIVWLLQLQ